MKESYFQSVVMIERLHRLFLDVMKGELDRLNIHDINNVQALILYNIGNSQLTVGELTNRGYYLGSNVSYNLRKMVQNGYVEQIPSPHDRRSSHVKLSGKGMTLFNKVDEILTRHASSLSGTIMKNNGLDAFCATLSNLEDFWKNLSRP